MDAIVHLPEGARRGLRLPVVLAVIAIGSVPALAQAQADDWQWSLTPYVWLPTIDGHLQHEIPPDGGGGPEISVGPTDWLDLVNFALMLSASATRAQFGLFTDLVYLDMGGDNDGRVVSIDTAIAGPGGIIEIPVGADLNVATEFELEGLQWMLAAGYAFADTETGTHYVIAGVRMLSIDVTTNWNLNGSISGPGGETLLDAQGGADRSSDLFDGIVGLKGRFGTGEDGWSVPYSVDVGAGDSDLVWNATVSLAYAFGWGELVLGYRHLYYDEGPNGTLQDFSLGGPGFGANFRF